jgi:ribosomal protein S18 acetylase RimI-like enzyme
MNPSPVIPARNITIREAQIEDAPAIVRLIRELAATAGDSSPITEAYVTKYLFSATGAILLAEMRQEIIGLLSYSLRPDLYHAAATCLIEELIVLEAERGKGVGSLLLKELLARLARMGCPEVSVTTMPDNAGAIKFYRRHGLVDEVLMLEHHFRPGD